MDALKSIDRLPIGSRFLYAMQNKISLLLTQAVARRMILVLIFVDLRMSIDVE